MNLSALGLLLCLLAPVAQAVAPDYSLWDELLLTHVRNGYVDYNGLSDDSRLQLFLDQLASTDPASVAASNERKSLLINAYNAYAIRGILDGQSTSSQSRRTRFFTRYRFTLMGETTTLQDIEHEQLRPMGDPRIHFAIVCASLSCPRLASRAFVPERLDQQLDVAASRFINDPTRNRFDSERGEAFVSQIFDWFAEDFTAGANSVQAYLAGYSRDPQATQLLRDEAFKLRYEIYDWGLNGQFDNPP